MKKLKKGFTLVELVIVIAVIAVLAAVLIPTFSGIIQRANYTADTTTIKTVNEILTEAGTPDTIDGVNAALKASEQNLSLETLAQKSGNIFAWEQISKKMVMLSQDYKVLAPENFEQTNAQYWILVSNANQVKSNPEEANFNLNYYMKNNFAGDISLTSPASFDTGLSTLTGSFTLDTDAAADIIIDGTISNTITIDAPNADVAHSGKADVVKVKAVAASSYHANNLVVNELTTEKGRIVLEGNTFVSELVVPSDATSALNIENKATIKDIAVVTAGTTTKKSTANAADAVVLPQAITFTSTQGKVETPNVENVKQNDISVTVNTDPSTKAINDYAELITFRDAVNAGAQFATTTFQLAADITLEDGWTPIGAFSRNTAEAKAGTIGFAGTFDGNNKTISNLNNKGFSPLETMLGENDTTVGNAKEYAYGFFGVIAGATIKNLTVTDVNIDIKTTAGQYGDSVGAIVGFANGGSILNCDVKKQENGVGYIYARDAVGGILGRAYYASITIDDCTNEIEVKGNVKVAGIAGFISTRVSGEVKDRDVIISTNTNKGKVTSTSTGDIKNDTNKAAGIATVEKTGAGVASIVVNANTNDAKITTDENESVNAIVIDITRADLNNLASASGNVATANSEIYKGATKVTTEPAINK